MVFNFRERDVCAEPKEIDLLVKALSETDILPLAEKWLYFKGYTAKLAEMDYIRAANISSNGDLLRFDATFDCRFSDSSVQRLTFRGMMVNEPPAVWYHLVEIYVGENKPDDTDFCRCDENLVPIIGHKDLDAEAEAFLRSFYPDALVEPQALPIKEILEDRLALIVLPGGRPIIGDGAADGGEQPFGQIFFAETPIEFTCPATGETRRGTASRGTILVELARAAGSEGCVNNTLAHEGLHWHRHRMYAAIHNILHHDKPFIACRKSARTPKQGKSWTDESRLEWQANSIAPRILMPKEPFKVKAREFMARRGYLVGAYNSSAALDAVIRDLAEFFAVSKQSVSIRLVEVGLINRAQQLSAATINFFSTTTSISPNDAFREYCENEDFRELLDTGVFRYVERRFVLNDKKYIAEVYGQEKLTNYARSHQRECCLTFTLRNVYPENGGMPKNVAYLRNGDKLKTAPRFEADNSVINAEEMRRLREQYKEEYGCFSIVTPTFSHYAVELMTKKHWNRAIFKDLTLLDDSAYTRITNGKTERITARTVAAFCVGIGANQAHAEKLFAAAGLSFNNSPERFAYCFLFGSMQGRGIDECNAFLESVGFEPLGIRQRAEPEAANQ